MSAVETCFRCRRRCLAFTWNGNIRKNRIIETMFLFLKSFVEKNKRETVQYEENMSLIFLTTGMPAWQNNRIILPVLPLWPYSNSRPKLLQWVENCGDSKWCQSKKREDVPFFECFSKVRQTWKSPFLIRLPLSRILCTRCDEKEKTRIVSKSSSWDWLPLPRREPTAV